MASNRLRSRYQGRPPARRCSHGGANNRMGGLEHCRWGAGSPQPSAAPPARDRCITPQPPPPPSGGPLFPWLLTDGHVLSPVSGHPGSIRAAWALPKRVPARGRGRETELFEGLCKGERGVLEPAGGFEPSAYGLRNRCSTSELRRPVRRDTMQSVSQPCEIG